jgi:Fis family transcriptional regulator
MNDFDSHSVPGPSTSHPEPLGDCVRSALEYYLNSMGDHEITGLYRLVINEVERPMLKAVLDHTNGNQSAAAEMLGISRGTLRKKLQGD